MLVDLQLRQPDVILQLIAMSNENDVETQRLAQGVYEIGHFSFDMLINEPRFERYPRLKDDFDHYGVGVCDDYRQVLEKLPVLEESKDRRFVISVTAIEKSKQPAEGGWRWKKWGEYIGIHQPTTEYLHDEPVIKKVYCYHVYEIL